MTCFVCFLEERSAEEMLNILLPKLFPENVEFKFVSFEGKQDLEKQIEKKLRGWNRPNSVFLIMRDQDLGDCLSIKENLLSKIPNDKRNQTIVRIACRELESFYLGDLKAVEQGLSLKNIAKKQKKSKFRSPDTLNASEEIKILTKGEYQKIAGSRAIAPYLDLENNHSHSFGILLCGIRTIYQNNFQ